MPAKTIPDGAGITNHFSAAFAPWIPEGAFTQIGALKDELEVIDGPDKRGYATGQATRQDLQVTVPAHSPVCKLMHKWKDACENGLPGHNAPGVVTVMDSGDRPIEVWELSNVIVKGVETKEMSIESAEVAQTMFNLSYARAKRIGP